MPRRNLILVALIFTVISGIALLIFKTDRPKTRMILSLDNIVNNQATFVVTNPTEFPASIIVKQIEVRTNEVWQSLGSQADFNQQFVVHSGTNLTITLRGPVVSAWRARFTSIERLPELSAAVYKVHFFFSQLRSPKGFSFPNGEVYHDIDIYSEEISAQISEW